RHFQAHSRLDFERFCRLEDWLSFGANRRRRFGAHSRLDFERFCRLEDWLSLSASRRRRFGAHSWLDLRFYTLDDRLNFGVGRQGRLRAGGGFDFERFCMFEGRRDFAADR
ncbi:MAG: hypothetical protein WA406_07530, partial [Pseudolabrys sp.]